MRLSQGIPKVPLIEMKLEFTDNCLQGTSGILIFNEVLHNMSICKLHLKSTCSRSPYCLVINSEDFIGQALEQFLSECLNCSQLNFDQALSIVTINSFWVKCL